MDFSGGEGWIFRLARNLLDGSRVAICRAFVGVVQLSCHAAFRLLHDLRVVGGVLLLSSYSWASMVQTQPPDVINPVERNCEQDSDCVLVSDLCGEPNAVNYKFKADVLKRIASAQTTFKCEKSDSEMSYARRLGIRKSECFQNKCTAKYNEEVARRSAVSNMLLNACPKIEKKNPNSKDSDNQFDFEASISCKVDSDCALVRRPCGEFDSFNKKFKEIYIQCFSEQQKYINCHNAFVSGDRKSTQYKAQCVKGICQAQAISKHERGTGGDIAGPSKKAYKSEASRSEIPERRVIEIAEKAFVERFGSEVLSQRPFNAVLVMNVWRVSGTLPCPPGGSCRGGVAEAEISVSGEVLSIAHGK